MMKEKTIEIVYKEYDNPEELNLTFQKLLVEAKNALEDSYSPYSNFKVGAAVLLSNEEIVCGSNIENASYPLCLCAEPSALAAASSKYPKEMVMAIAVTVKNPEMLIETPASPCGACRQIISEREHRQKSPIKIILRGEEGPIYVFDSINYILPFSFNGSFL